MKNFDFDAAFDDFMENAPDSFTAGEVLDHMINFCDGALPPDRDQAIDEITEIMTDDQMWFVHGFGDQAEIQSRNAFFKNTVFKILPGQEEIRNNVLVCGARFVPFSPVYCFYEDYELSDKDAPEEILELKNYRGPFARYAKPYLLLGRSETIDTLVADDERNYQALHKAKTLDKTEIRLTLFDMTGFYKRHDFRTGDAIYVTIKDWENGRFELEYVPSGRLSGEPERENFLTAFEDALADVYKAFGEYQPPCDQISYAYYFASRGSFDLRKHPALSLDEYPALMRDIAINRDEPEWYFMPADSEDYDYTDAEDVFDIEEDHECSCHHDHEHGHECSCHHDHGKKEQDPELAELYEHEEGAQDPRIPRHFSVSKGRMDTLEGILDDINSPVPFVEMYAMMLDDLANGGESFDDFYSRLSGCMGTTFVDEAQESAFLNYLEEIWEDAVERFNPVHEETKMPLRSRLLELASAHREHAGNLIRQYKEQVPREIVLKMKSFHSRIMETLGVVDADVSLPEGDALEQLELRIGDIEDDWDDFTTATEPLTE